MTPHETKVRDLVREFEQEGFITEDEMLLVAHMIRSHFPEPQNEYTLPQLCAKCNQQPTIMTTETPRTDAQVFTAQSVPGSNSNTNRPQPCVMADFARQLERELNELRKDKERLDWVEKCYDWQFRPTPTSIFYCHEFRDSLRTAIDAAKNK
jgi:hypothetical protein